MSLQAVAEGGATARTHRSRPPGPRVLAEHLTVLGGYGIFVAIGVALSTFSDLSAPLAPLLLLEVAGVLVIMARTSFPTFAVAGGLLLLPLSFWVGAGAETFVLAVVLFSVSIQCTLRDTWKWYLAALLSLVTASCVFSWRINGGGAPFLGTAPRAGGQALLDAANLLAIIGFPLLVLVLLGMNLGSRRRYVAGLVERADQLRRERDQQATIARADERERIAREMHDVIAHSLAVMIALADGAEASVKRQPEEAQKAIRGVGETGRRALSEVRRLLSRVRSDEHGGPALDQSQVGIPDLSALVDEFRSAGLPVVFHVGGEIPSNPVYGFTVYRIVQESLTNVLRHGRGVRKVQVSVDFAPSGVAVVVEDLADMVKVPSESGRGLLGIRERAMFYDGEVMAGPRSGGGWRVEVRLPFGDHGEIA
ncbi:sensor histidine kinase [Brachybacterium huguangmaarense]